MSATSTASKHRPRSIDYVPRLSWKEAKKMLVPFTLYKALEYPDVGGILVSVPSPKDLQCQKNLDNFENLKKSQLVVPVMPHIYKYRDAQQLADVFLAKQHRLSRISYTIGALED
ncbi:unnamed protein product [Clonostachys byssicola]|uniref:Uncharacterized protein n=1 Tax=Clonostachys byssicola TaxID=160290 RepID=A0A9N9Y2Y0_9HYPO|nr:unnamed protein product [Clonostachys byssicola]